MENLNIGRSGIEVPFLGMGTWAIGGGSWWGDNDDALSVKAIQTAVEQGIRWIDTAPIYGLYHSETVVGEALKHIDRDKVVLSTKCGLEWRHETPVLHKVVDGTAVYRDLSAQSIIEDVEDSLRRLGTDHLDVLYTHWQSPDLGLYPLEETVEAMMKLKEQGKIRAIGASNVTADLIRGYCRYGQLDVIQEKYSLLTRRIEKQLLPTCRELGVSVQAYSPLEQGLLTGKVTMETTFPEGSTRNSNPCFQPARRKQALDLLAKWDDLTGKYDCTSLTHTQIRNTLAAFQFTGEEVFKQIRTLSGGEKGRVSLAKLMLSEANFLILDEPTNHLDITSKEILEEALNNYSGTVLYVSHDRYFINQTCSRILELVNQTFVNYIGNYDYYLEKKEELTRAYASAPAVSAGIAPSESSSDNQTESKLSWQEQKEQQAKERKRKNDLKKTEEEIAKLEERNTVIDEELTKEEIYSNSIECQKLSTERAENEEKLEVLYERWEELAEEV